MSSRLIIRLVASAAVVGVLGVFLASRSVSSAENKPQKDSKEAEILDHLEGRREEVETETDAEFISLTDKRENE